MSVTKSADSHPVDVNVASLAVIVAAVNADSGAGVIALSPTNVAGARIARRNNPWRAS
jgi:hypothetical protein